MSDETETLYCSFCAKSQHDVGKLIAGPAHVGICDECVALCATIVLAETESGCMNAWYLTREKPLSQKEIIKEIVDELRAYEAKPEPAEA